MVAIPSSPNPFFPESPHGHARCTCSPPPLARTGLAVAVAVILLTGCHAVDVVVKPFSGGATQLADTAGDVRAKADETIAVADQWQAIAPSDDHHARIIGLQGAVVSLTGKLGEQAKGLKESERACDRLREENAKLKDEAEKANRSLWRWLQFLGAAALIGAAVLAYFAPPLAPLVGIAGASAIAIGSVMLAYGWLINLVMLGVVLLGLIVVGLTTWHKYRIDGRDAEGMAKLARDALNDHKPETVREFFAALRKGWGEFDRAMDKVKKGGA